MKTRILTTFLLAFFSLMMHGQMIEPVRFTSRLDIHDNGEAEIVFRATIDDGWHVYSTDMGSDGPISATFNVVKMEGVLTVGSLKPLGKLVSQYDKMFGMELRFFEHNAAFVQKVRFTKPDYEIDCYLEYGACNDEMCLPPSQVELKQAGKAPVSAKKEEADTQQKENAGQKNAADTVSKDTAATVVIPVVGEIKDIQSGQQGLWRPVIQELQAFESKGQADETVSWWFIFIQGLLGGFLALFTPCVWPIIPMTVSFFLKRAKTSRRRGIRDALIYGLSIVVIYLTLGLLVTAIFGSDTLNALSTNAVFNVLLFLLLVVFALSFFGWFEIRLPESWASRVDEKADSLSAGSSSWTTYLSIFLMALTLVLVSFSCTAPIVGLLLVETATSGQWLAPAVGMLGFAVALALPFTLFALFPSWLQQAPKSGSWMNTLKVTLGFIELAFALKFLSVADLAYGWHILDREVFLSLWIVIFALLGAYLCGWLKLVEEEQRGKWQVPCVMGGLVSLAFAMYMVPGLWGAPCKAVSAFAPPMYTQDFNMNSKVVEARYNDFDEALAAARRENKPILIDFTGFGCVNCRKMEAAVWTDPQVADMLMNDYILVSLYVDDKTPLPENIEVEDGQGGTRTLRTVGAKWSDLQRRRFGTNAQPYYVIVDSEGRQLSPGRGYDEDVAAFVKFLKQTNYE